MDDQLWCPQGHEAREPTPAGRFSAVCGCGTRFSTRPGVQDAFRPAAGAVALVPAAVHGADAGRVDTPGARRAQSADDGSRTLVLEAWPEHGPPAILSVPSRDEAEGGNETLERAAEDDQDPTVPKRHSDQLHPPDRHAEEPEEPKDPEPDVLDWIFGR